MTRLFLVMIAMSVLSTTAVAEAPVNLSGTWQWQSRTIARPMVIRQTSTELIVEALGLPQGSGEEAFWLDGSERVEVRAARGFWRKQATAGHWEGLTWVGTVRAFAGWTADTVAREPHTTMTRRFTLDPSGMNLTIVSSGHRPAAGSTVTAVVDELVRQ